MGDGDGRDGRGITGKCGCLGVYAVAGRIWVDAYEVYACELNGIGALKIWAYEGKRQLF